MAEHAPEIERRYRSCRFGEIHLRYLGPRGAETSPPLLCLHPSPFSGAYFTTVMPRLNQGRAIIAPDYPGYGGSTPTDDLPSIDDYANAMLDLLDDMNVAHADIVGFHTGCLVGVEMALRDSARVNRLVLIDVPYFAGDERAEVYERAAEPRTFDADPGGLLAEWDGNVTRKTVAMPFDRAYELFVESLRAADRSHWGFHAAFTYASDEKFPLLTTSTVVIATQSGLLDATRNAVPTLRDVTFVERLDITRAVFEEGAAGISTAIIEALG